MTTTTPAPARNGDYEKKIADAVNHWMALPQKPDELLDLNDTVMITDTPMGVPWPNPRVKETSRATLLAEVVGALPMAVVALDYTGKVKLWTDAAVMLFGWTSAEVIGEVPPFVDAAHTAEHDAVLKLLRSGNVTGERIVSRRGKDTKARTLAMAATQTVAGDIVLTFREVLASRVATVADTKDEMPADKQAALGRMIGAVSHDFNNVLGAICGSAEMMSDRFPYGSPERELINVIRTAGKHATGLTKRLMTFAKPVAAKPGPIIDLAGVVNDLLPLIRSLVPTNVHVTYPPAPNLPGTPVEMTILEQVILNLATNAGQAMPNGGSLRLRTDSVTLALPKLNLNPGPYVVLTVSDTGIGFDDATRQRIFEPYFTTKARGTGLGLTTVNELVRSAGGSIELESESGRGSTFRVFFPAVPQAAPSVNGNGKTALIAEDDPTIRELIQRVLESVGFDVSTAATGDEALQQARWLSNDVDLLVTDVVMPGLGGRKLAEKLRADWPDLAVVFASGYPPVEETLPPRTLFITKPFNPRGLLAAVGSVLQNTPV